MSTLPQGAGTEAGDVDFDPDALRQKYRQERDKRLRVDANDQYQDADAEFSHFVDDPYVAPGFQREPMLDAVDAIVVGGGIGGLLAGARFRQAGLTRVRLIEKGGDFGGTWYWNRYPGAQCDMESFIYLPLLEEMGYLPKEKYARGPEILSYLQSVGRANGLYEDACFQTEVTGMTWDEGTALWTVTTNRGDRMTARFVVISSGPLNRPKLPGVPGIASFKGHTFHTSRWDYDYTGGDADGSLVGLADKRVAVIGTGATAVQCVPALGAAAKHLFVFQRTPSSIGERNNRAIEPDWLDAMSPGWHRERMANFNALVSGQPQEVDLVNDGWTDVIRKVAGMLFGAGGTGVSKREAAALMELADFEKMEELRGRIDAIIEDPDTAEALKPYYRMFCKRPCFSDDYLPTFNRPNVTLVDTDGRGVERFTDTGIVVDGVEYEVDCVVFATGFEVGRDYTRRAGFDIEGRDGARLSEKWAAGPSTLHGFFTSGFPNLFFLGNSQTGLTPNFSHMLDEQTTHVTHVVEHVIGTGARYVEATPQAEAEWVATIGRLSTLTRDFLNECTPGYYNQEGNLEDPNSQFSGAYGPGSVAFFELLRAWREDGSFSGLVVA